MRSKPDNVRSGRGLPQRKTELVAGSWRWLRLQLNRTGQTLRSETRATFSPHVLNLRPEAGSAPLKLSQSQAPVQVSAVSLAQFDLNLLPQPPRAAPFPDYLLARLTARWPRFGELAIVGLLEVAWWLMGFGWNYVTKFFVALSWQLGGVAREIASDVKTFLGVVLLVIALPFKFLLPPLRGRATFSVSSFSLVQAVSFLLVALSLALPIKTIATWQDATSLRGTVLGLATDAFEDFQSGAAHLSAGQPGSAQVDFERARESLAEAYKLLNVLPEQTRQLIAAIPGPARQLATASYILSASRALAEAASLTAVVWEDLTNAGGPGELDLTLPGETLGQAIDKILPLLDEASLNLSLVDVKTLPPTAAPRMVKLQADLLLVKQAINELSGLPAFLKRLLAESDTARYVVLFQNSNELRPTGGFPGSLAFIEIEAGRVRSVEIPGGGPYDFQGSLKQVIRPPEPLRLVRGEWQLQDATWFFDFPTSARKVLWFIQAAGGPKAQGVVVLTPDVVIELLKLTGPIEVTQYGKTITAENFVRETQTAVELEYDRVRNQPKQFIADFAPLLMERVLNLPPQDTFQLLTVVERALRQRSLQLFFEQPELQASVAAYGWGGEIRQVPHDYLAVVRTNIGGGKTDGVTDEALSYNVEIQPSGQLVARLTFVREHRGSSADIFEQRRNNSYVRFYVPAGSVLLEAAGFNPPPEGEFQSVPQTAGFDQELLSLEQTTAPEEHFGLRVAQEFGKTSFGGWLRVAPGERRVVTLTYRLPFKLAPAGRLLDLGRYSAYFQRQAGVKPVDFKASLTLPESWRVRWQEGSRKLSTDLGTISLAGDLTTDEYYGLLLERVD